MPQILFSLWVEPFVSMNQELVKAGDFDGEEDQGKPKCCWEDGSRRMWAIAPRSRSA